MADGRVHHGRGEPVDRAADGLSEIAAGLVSQGLTILDSVSKGMPNQPQAGSNGRVMTGEVAARES